ncbi:MAG: CocE/NonD family hydrolase [Actinomycetota bacterium]|nr:CocE/NonD family hydrolase [Actinomycetota bacterium]
MRAAPEALDRPWRRPGRLRYALARVRGVIRPPVEVYEPPADLVDERDVAVPTRDGVLLRANVFRPPGDERRPVVLCIHPYGKDNLPRRSGGGRWRYSPQYRILRQPAPVRFSSLTGWEAPDPAWWAAQGFAVVNADLRGCGTSEGTAQLLSPQEGRDCHDIVEWAAQQPWSDGRVVMVGVSYLAISQYAAAAQQPPSLRAIIPWEGFTDAYRDFALPGGVRETGFMRLWGTMIRRTVRQAYDLGVMQRRHPLRDAFWESLTPDLNRVQVPMLVCGSFSDQALHSRGSMRAFAASSSAVARLYTHRGGKWATFYSEDARAEQLRFIRQVLDGAPPARSVRLEVREDATTVHEVREESQWPPTRIRWRPLHLSSPGVLADDAPAAPGSVSFDNRSRAAAFTWDITEDIEITGPMSARLWLQTEGCADVNLFVGVEKWRQGRFVPFEGSYGYGRDRVATGWQRASLRGLDERLSRPGEPVPTCTDPRPLRAGEVVAVDVGLGPSATLFRSGEQLRLIVAARWLAPVNPLYGSLPSRYARSPRGRTTLHWGPERAAHLLIPEVPRPGGPA